MGRMGVVSAAQGALSRPGGRAYLWGAPGGGAVARMWEGRREALPNAGGGGGWKTDFKSQSQPRSQPRQGELSAQRRSWGPLLSCLRPLLTA